MANPATRAGKQHGFSCVFACHRLVRLVQLSPNSNTRPPIYNAALGTLRQTL
jgi:hypothetical protein